MGQSAPIPVLSLVVQLMIDIIFNEDAVLQFYWRNEVSLLALIGAKGVTKSGRMKWRNRDKQ